MVEADTSAAAASSSRLHSRRVRRTFELVSPFERRNLHLLLQVKTTGSRKGAPSSQVSPEAIRPGDGSLETTRFWTLPHHIRGYACRNNISTGVARAPWRRLRSRPPEKETTMSCYPRFAPALLALALLSASPALSQGRPGTAPPSTASFTEAVLGFLPDFLVRLWGEEGCRLDPYGAACRQATTTSTHRRPLTAVWAEAGCGLDPYGRCLPQPATPQSSSH